MSRKIHDAFDTVHAEESLKKSTKAFIFEQTRTNTKVKTPHFRRIAVSFACLVIVMLGFGGWNLYMTPVSAISVDVNPSVELGINRFDRVVSAESYNDDGAKIIASVDLKNLKYTDALAVLFDSEAIVPYMKDDTFVSITVVGDTAQREEEMYSRISSCHYAEAHDVECCYGNRELIDEAHEAGLSFGKYRAFQELQALDPDITTEDIRGWTMRQIRDCIDELSNGSNVPQDDNGGKGHGSQNHETNKENNSNHVDIGPETERGKHYGNGRSGSGQNHEEDTR